MLRLLLALMVAISFPALSYAKEETLAPNATKESVCRVMIAELHKFGKMAEPNIEQLTPDPGKSRHFAYLNPEVLKTVDAAASIYKNLDCDKVLMDR